MAGKRTPSFGVVSHSWLSITMKRTRFSRIARICARSAGGDGAPRQTVHELLEEEAVVEGRAMPHPRQPVSHRLADPDVGPAHETAFARIGHQEAAQQRHHQAHVLVLEGAHAAQHVQEVRAVHVVVARRHELGGDREVGVLRVLRPHPQDVGGGGADHAIDRVEARRRGDARPAARAAASARARPGRAAPRSARASCGSTPRPSSSRESRAAPLGTRPDTPAPRRSGSTGAGSSSGGSAGGRIDRGWCGRSAPGCGRARCGRSPRAAPGRRCRRDSRSRPGGLPTRLGYQ